MMSTQLITTQLMSVTRIQLQPFTFTVFILTVFLFALCMFLGAPFAYAAEPVTVATEVSQQPTTAKITQIRGRVVVNTGNNYQIAKPNSVLPTGAKVLAVGESSATLVYQEGCSHEVKGNSQITIGGREICQGMAQNQRIYEPLPNMQLAANQVADASQAAMLEVVKPTNYLPATAALFASVVVLVDHHRSDRRLPDISPD
jgi:hypothetical protein